METRTPRKPVSTTSKASSRSCLSISLPLSHDSPNCKSLCWSSSLEPMGLCSTFICFLYRHTLRWAAYYGRLFPACMLGLLICLLKYLVVCFGTRSIPSLILGQYKRICFPLPHPQHLRWGQGRLWPTGERRKELRSPRHLPTFQYYSHGSYGKA